MERSRLTEDQLRAAVRLTTVAARAIEVAQRSLDPAILAAGKELAAFVLGIVRTLEATSPQAVEGWRLLTEEELERPIFPLLKSTGNPSFLDPAFLVFLRENGIEIAPPS
jgi:hypothetical protein